MPLDPNIPLSYQPPQLPDFNAMAQQQGQNVANMMTIQNSIEDRAAAVDAAETARMEKALAPAIAAAFSNPTDEGLAAAFDLVPDAYKDAAAEQLAQLQAIPDATMRKSVLRTGLLQSDYGKALIAQVEPSANMVLQAQTAGRRAALDERRYELDVAKMEAEAAAPQGSYSTVKGADGKTYLMNNKTGEIREPTLEDGSGINVGAENGDMDPKVKLKLDQSYPKASQALQSTVTGLDQDIADVEALMADPGLKDISGLWGGTTPNISENSRRAQALYDKIKSGAGFAALQSMRLSSPTGGALGNVSNQEGDKLEKSVAAFSQKQNYDDLKRALRTYLIDLKVAKDNVQAAFDDTYSYRGESPSAGIVDRATQTRQRLENETPQVTTKSRLPPGVTVRKN